MSLGAIFLPKEFEEWMTEEFLERKINETCKTLDVNVAHVPANILTAAMIKSLHNQNLKVHSHSYLSDMGIDEEVQEYKKFCDWGIDQCTFDNINLLDKI